jgi:uncharacterized membrane protein
LDAKSIIALSFMGLQLLIGLYFWQDQQNRFIIQVVEALEYASENEILLRGGSVTDLNDSDTLVLNYITQVSNGNFSVIIKTADFYTNLVENGLTTKPTLHAALNRLEQSGIIKKPEKGLYQLSPSS